MPGRAAAWHPPFYGVTSNASDKIIKALRNVYISESFPYFRRISCVGRIAKRSAAQLSYALPACSNYTSNSKSP